MCIRDSERREENERRRGITSTECKTTVNRILVIALNKDTGNRVSNGLGGLSNGSTSVAGWVRKHAGVEHR
eukprot:9272346-Alexandrium_andersonii.AAC.1